MHCEYDHCKRLVVVRCLLKCFGKTMPVCMHELNVFGLDYLRPMLPGGLHYLLLRAMPA